MDIQGWNDRYRMQNHSLEEHYIPTSLVVDIAGTLTAGKALDLACGSGRNALWLARQGWDVTALDGSAVAIDALREQAATRSLSVTAVTTDLEKDDPDLGESAWDLVVIAYYLQRDLMAKAKASVKPGGVLIAIVHITEDVEEPTAHRTAPGELRSWFDGWQVLHTREGASRDNAHRRSVAEIAARKS